MPFPSSEIKKVYVRLSHKIHESIKRLPGIEYEYFEHHIQQNLDKN